MESCLKVPNLLWWICKIIFDCHYNALQCSIPWYPRILEILVTEASCLKMSLRVSEGGRSGAGSGRAAWTAGWAGGGRGAGGWGPASGEGWGESPGEAWPAGGREGTEEAGSRPHPPPGILQWLGDRGQAARGTSHWRRPPGGRRLPAPGPRRARSSSAACPSSACSGTKPGKGLMQNEWITQTFEYENRGLNYLMTWNSGRHRRS